MQIFLMSVQIICLWGKKNIDELSEPEKDWLYLYGQLSDHNKIECVGFVKGYIASQKYRPISITKAVKS